MGLVAGAAVMFVCSTEPSLHSDVETDFWGWQSTALTACCLNVLRLEQYKGREELAVGQAPLFTTWTVLVETIICILHCLLFLTMGLDSM